MSVSRGRIRRIPHDAPSKAPPADHGPWTLAVARLGADRPSGTWRVTSPNASRRSINPVHSRSSACPLRSPGLPARPGAAAVSARLRPSRFVAQPIAYPDTPSGIVADLIAKRTLGAYRSSIARAIRSWRSEEHTSELQSLMRISYAVFCLKKKINTQQY